MPAWKRFPYTPPSGAGKGLLPFAQVILISRISGFRGDALLDSGATVSVLPHSVGITLGFDWHAERPLLPLGGNLAKHEAKSVLLQVALEGFPPQLMSFAWSRSESVPIILGQRNFFDVFDVRSSEAKYFDLQLVHPTL
jgi:hypothetical protein